MGAKSGETTVTVDGALGLSVTVSPDPPVAGRPATFTIAVTVPAGGNLVQQRAINFGDGESRTLSVASTGGQTTVAHTYEDDGTYTVSVTVDRHRQQRPDAATGDRSRAGAPGRRQPRGVDA